MMHPKYEYLLEGNATPFQTLIQAVNGFIEGTESCAGLNGAAHGVAHWAREEGLHPEIIEIAQQIHIQVNRHWNEWGLNPDPISRDEFVQWLKREILPNQETEPSDAAPDGQI